MPFIFFQLHHFPSRFCIGAVGQPGPTRRSGSRRRKRQVAVKAKLATYCMNTALAARPKPVLASTVAFYRVQFFKVGSTVQYPNAKE